jgi:hypothetical protein
MSLLSVQLILALLLQLLLQQPQLQGNTFPSSGEEEVKQQGLLLQKQIVGVTVAAGRMVTGGIVILPHLVLVGVQGHLQLGHLPGCVIVLDRFCAVIYCSFCPLGFLPDIVLVALIFARVLRTLPCLSFRILFLILSSHLFIFQCL